MLSRDRAPATELAKLFDLHTLTAGRERREAYKLLFRVEDTLLAALGAEPIDHPILRRPSAEDLQQLFGLNTHQRALDAGDSEHGCTVHFVTEELDGGPLAVQGAVSIDAEDTAESLQQKVHKVEHQIYPLAVELFCADRLQWSEQGVSLDGSPLSSSGYRYNG